MRALLAMPAGLQHRMVDDARPALVDLDALRDEVISGRLAAGEGPCCPVDGTVRDVSA